MQTATRHLPGIVLAAVALGSLETPVLGYVGPGAGFALVSGFLVIFTTIVLAGLSLLVWPFRMVWRFLLRKPIGKPVIKRFIVVGLDGQDPRITDRLMAEGKLPNFQKLADQGSYRRLQTVYPSLSPVAWSSFSTGTNPGGHNVFDFVERDPRNYMPKQASVEIGKLEKTMKVGPFKIPLHKPTLRLLRKSKPFWTILGEHNIWSTVLRVPITFPPDKFYGAQLSAMMVPDLLGTLGTFLHYSSRSGDAASRLEGSAAVEGGQSFPLARDGDAWEGTLEGPENSFREGDPPMALPLRVVAGADGKATVTIGKDSIELVQGKISDWFTLTFQPMPGIKVQGITRLQLLESGEHVSLYLSPINLDSEKPAMPISHPGHYSTYLSKKARRCFSPHSTASTKAAWCACSTERTVSSTCSGVTTKRVTLPTTRHSTRPTATPSTSSTSTTTAWSARCWRRSRTMTSCV